jgi:hypothetical protein
VTRFVQRPVLVHLVFSPIDRFSFLVKPFFVRSSCFLHFHFAVKFLCLCRHSKCQCTARQEHTQKPSYCRPVELYIIYFTTLNTSPLGETSRLLEQPFEQESSTTMPRHDYDDQGYWASGFRELRHTSCFMAPLSVAMFLVFGLFLLITLLIQAPVLLLGLLLSPILSRTPWYIEFLYPWGIARWAHFFLISHSSRQRHRDEDKNRGFHSRTIEQKFEVVKGRVYIHPLPQLLDNLGYLVVCLPPPKTEEGSNVRITVQDNKNPILALVVDCGDAQATLKLVDLIQEYHYPNQIIKIHSICSTHKHHDHTGGNRELLSTKDTIKYVYGGAVERVPQCNHPLANGDKLDLPKFQLIPGEVWCISCVPNHKNRARRSIYLLVIPCLVPVGAFHLKPMSGRNPNRKSIAATAIRLCERVWARRPWRDALLKFWHDHCPM